MPLALPPGLSNNQEALWLEQQLFIGKPIYNTGQVISIRGKLRLDLFDEALRQTIAESPGLLLPPRTGSAPFEIPLLDFRQRKDPLASAEQWMRDEMRRAISLEDPSLFRYALLQVGDDHVLWFQKYHHIIIDATGRRLLSQRVAQRYRALRFGQPPPVVDAATPDELLAIERRYLASDAYKADREYWLKQFSNWPGPLLDVDRRNTERLRSGVPARTSFTIKREDFVRLETAARRLGSSVFRALIAVNFVAFARLYNRYHLVFGLELANRPDAKAQQMIGYLAHPTPMLLTLDPTTTLAELLNHVEACRAQNYPHRRFAVQDLARELGITRKGHHGLFDVIINFIPATYDFTFENSPIEVTNLSYGFAAPFMVTIADTGSPRDLAVTIDTDPGLISSEAAARLASAVELLLLQGLSDPSCPLAALPIMPDTARAEVSALAAGRNVPLPTGATVATMCAAQAERTPDAVAIRYRESQITYAALNRRVEILARRLASVGVRPGVIVGIALPREPNLLVAVLAVHRAGGAYLALDPSYPEERIRFIVRDAATPVIITNPTLAKTFADSGAELLFESEAADAEPLPIDPVAAGPNDLAYVLYTSGSTGRPKAVGIEHRNLVNLICWGRSILSDAELHGVLFSTSLNFDLSAFEMFVPLAFGGCIVLVDNLLAIQTAEQRDKVRLVNTGPSLLEALLRAEGLPAGVTTVILAGERLSRRLANSLFEVAPGVRLLNCYGPTETTVYSSWSQVLADASEPAIGRPIWNTSLHVLGAGCALLPAGIEGELFIGGAGVARGYLGRKELTAERFLPDPDCHGWIYRTGDRVRWRQDGELEFLGRADDQMKINGIRVEPGEIEATLLAIPGIAAAVVALVADSSDLRRLTAYLVGSEGARPAIDDVRAILARKLPANMVPTYFIWLDALPLTPNGKLDRKALPAPARDTPPPINQPPRTRLERDIAAIWEETLQVSPIGMWSDFFELGGDSLGLVSLFAGIEAKFGRSLTVDVLAGGLTIASLAQALSDDKAIPAGENPIVALQPNGDLPPFFCVHGVGGDVIHLHRLAAHMGTRRPFFAIRRSKDAPFAQSIEEIAAGHISAMLLQQPVGPYYLGGYSFGATVAFEMARQLKQQGHEIGLLAIIDQRRPAWQLTVPQAIPALHHILRALPQRIREELAETPPGARLQRLPRLALRWSKAAFGFREGAVSKFNIRPDDLEKLQKYEANLRAIRAYRPDPLRAPLTLFRAERQVRALANLALDASLGWSDLVTDGVRVLIVPGSHYTMATEPNVVHLARALAGELDAAQNVPCLSPSASPVARSIENYTMRNPGGR